jgi:MFS family permease
MRDSHPGSDPSEKPLPRAFNLFWIGQGVSALGDAMTIVAMPLVVLAVTSSVEQMGNLTALARVAGLIATALAGFVVDRAEPGRVLLACDFFRFVLMALIPVAFFYDFREVWLVFAVGMGAALAQGVFYVGHVSLVAALVGRARVSIANSRVEGTIALAYVFGPLLAGLLSARFGPANVLGIDALTFLLSVLALLAMGRVAAAPQEITEHAASSKATVGLAGLKFLRNQPELWRLTILVALCQFFTAAIVDLFIFRLKRELGQGDSTAGLTFAIASAAAVAAAVGTPRLRTRFGFRRLWVVAVLLQGLALLGAYSAHSLAPVALAAAIYMAAMTTLLICQASIRQELTPQHLLGRVTSSYLVLVTLPVPLGALAATQLAARFGAAPVMAGLGAGLLLTATLASAIWAVMPTVPRSP